MFFDVNKSLCDVYSGLNPLELLNYPAEDVFNLISGTLDYNNRTNKDKPSKSGVIRRQAQDNWF